MRKHCASSWPGCHSPTRRPTCGVGDQAPTAGADIVADAPHVGDVLLTGVVDLPVLVALFREERADVAAAHGDDDGGRFGILVREDLGFLVGTSERGRVLR